HRYSLPPCERKVRVGANSPSLCPTIDSEMKTGTCFLPSWTAIVCPTISGNTVEVRDQVLTICFLPASFMAPIRAISLSSTHGPFFVERPISGHPSSCRGACRARCNDRTACPSYGSGSRASACPRGLPDGRQECGEPRRRRAGDRPGSSPHRDSAAAFPYGGCGRPC